MTAIDREWLDIIAGLYVASGQVVTVTRCKPSRRRAGGSVQKARYQRVCTGALYAAMEAGKKLTTHGRED